MDLKFNPNLKSSSKQGIFGLPCSQEEANVIFLPIPWDVTTSYKAGSSKGPRAILKASDQIDLFDLEYGNAYEQGLFMQKEKTWIKALNKNSRPIAKKIIDAPEEKISKSKTLTNSLKKINNVSIKINNFVYSQCQEILAQGKIPAVVGGDHSVPYGAIKAASENHKNLGILHFDAHSDTRKSYMGFIHSHASIMYNVAEDLSVKKIVQVGIRDFCQEEFLYTKNNKKFEVFYDLDIQRKKLSGVKFLNLANAVIDGLPKNVYISFDIDALDPKLCPNTGTPVPGGLDFYEIGLILNRLVESKRKIVGFDLVEVAPSLQKNNDWDANVGMRVLYKLACASISSNQRQ